jgi:hypothetical protein
VTVGCWIIGDFADSVKRGPWHGALPLNAAEQVYLGPKGVRLQRVAGQIEAARVKSGMEPVNKGVNVVYR